MGCGAGVQRTVPYAVDVSTEDWTKLVMSTYMASRRDYQEVAVEGAKGESLTNDLQPVSQPGMVHKEKCKKQTTLSITGGKTPMRVSIECQFAKANCNAPIFQVSQGDQSIDVTYRRGHKGFDTVKASKEGWYASTLGQYTVDLKGAPAIIRLLNKDETVAMTMLTFGAPFNELRTMHVFFGEVDFEIVSEKFNTDSSCLFAVLEETTGTIAYLEKNNDAPILSAVSLLVLNRVRLTAFNSSSKIGA